MSEELKRGTDKKKASLVTLILKGQTTISEAFHKYALLPSEIACWLEDVERALECAPHPLIPCSYQRKILDFVNSSGYGYSIATMAI